MGQNRVLVCGARQAGSPDCFGTETGRHCRQFEEAIHENRAEELLNWINVYAGDMIYVAGGTVHTLGPGSIIVETQQQSDTTYRLYDYGRPRELHLKDGLAAVKEKVASGKVLRPAPSRDAAMARIDMCRWWPLRILWWKCSNARNVSGFHNGG